MKSKDGSNCIRILTVTDILTSTVVMGRKGRARRRRRRSEAAQLAANCHNRLLEREVDDSLIYQACKEEYNEHAKQIAKREEELLSRTIFVTNVKDLRVSRNLELLKSFFAHQHGPVEQCILAYQSRQGGRRGNRQYPRARVRFLHERDAKKVFGGTKLSLVDSPVTVSCPTVGHRGLLRIFPSRPYEGMDESSDENKVVIMGDCVHVGHHCPLENDIEDEFITIDERSRLLNEFLTEDTIRREVQLSIDIDARLVQIRLHREENEMISFRFKDIVQGTMDCYVESQGGSYALVFRLKYPPKLYKLRCETNTEGVEEEVATRGLEICGIRNQTFGRCFALLIQVSRRNLQALFTESKRLRKLKRFGLIDNNLFSLDDAPDIAIRGVSDDSGQVESLLRSATDRRVGLLLRSLMDTGRFSWYHALHDKVETPSGELNIFELVELIPQVETFAALETMSSLSRPTSYPAHVFNAFAVIGDDSGSEIDDSGELSMPVYCTTTPRLLLTPTRLAVVRFSVEMSNRVVRHFVSNEGFAPECFLRVAIGEENGERLFVDQLSHSICGMIQSLVLNGISLNGSLYRFLAYSSSQLKESSLWMVNVQGPWTIDSMRVWMGDFSKCETPSKVAARMGQCFSTTVVASEGSARAWRVKDDFPDVLTVHNGKEMCHSDGTGLIDKSVLESFVGGLPLGPNEPTEVSIIQVRFGGAKGTLTGWDFSQLAALGNALPSSRRHDVLLRPSMVKFDVPYRELEVITFGKRIPYYLNRNVIMLLKVHGIQDDIFLGMQRRMLDSLDAMLVDPRKAVDLIPRLGGADNSLSSSLIHMISCGLSPTTEPFLFSCLHAIRAHNLVNLRKKSRILVNKGAVLLGGLDESGLLPEGCIFVQVNKEDVSPVWTASFRKTSVFDVITGPVMVTKHPVMHPGDVRMLLAVDIPELRGHKNVILFSRHGSRPEANKMSGSDLDGDQFAVTWDERLFLGQWNGCRQQSGTWRSVSGVTIFMRADTMVEDATKLLTSNKNPMDFDPSGSTGNSSSDQDGFEFFLASIIPHIVSMMREDTASSDSTAINNTINDSELLGHFINHAKTDNLGHIASMWLDYANKNGADCEQCLKLAALHSIAVDFPKSGIPAVVPKDLFISRSTARPHWREKKGLPSYDCEGVVGRLYNEVVSKMEGSENLNHVLVPLAGRRSDRHGQILRFIDKNASVERHLSEIHQPRLAIKLGMDLEAALDPESPECAVLNEAMDHRDEYEQNLVGLMNRYSLHSEGELLTGCIRKYHKADRRRQHDVSEAIRMQCRELKKNCRRIFFSSVLETVCPGLLQADETTEHEEKEWLQLIEAAVTGKPYVIEETQFVDSQIQEFKTVAYRLAAAYYEVTYNPELRWEYSGRNRSSILFSFPWTVADVVSAGLDDPQQPPMYVFVQNNSN